MPGDTRHLVIDLVDDQYGGGDRQQERSDDEIRLLDKRADLGVGVVRPR
jgi:hypothetical protein